MKNKTYILIFSILTASAFAQLGGTKVYKFLDLNVPARSTALAGATMGIWDDDINLAYNNPALLNKDCHKQLAFNYVNYVADLNYGNFAYAHHVDKIGTFAAGLQYFNYGKFDGRDEYNEQTGTFQAADYALNLTYARPLKDSAFSFGATLKTIYSHYDQYYSIGSALDAGLTYHNEKHLLAISLLAKNYGHIWKPYSNTNIKESLPFNVQFGISKKVKKAPFRLIAVYDQLLKWDLTYTSPLDESNQIDPFTKEPAKQKSKTQVFGDKFLRHWLFATEVIITKNFNLRLGYNYRLQKETTLPDKRSASGLSFGLGFKIYKFHFNYAFSKYHVAGNSHTFSITTNLNYFSK